MQYYEYENRPDLADVTIVYNDNWYLLGWVVERDDANGAHLFYAAPYAGVPGYDEPYSADMCVDTPLEAKASAAEMAWDPDTWHPESAGPRGETTFEKAVINLMEHLVSDERNAQAPSTYTRAHLPGEHVSEQPTPELIAERKAEREEWSEKWRQRGWTIPEGNTV